MATRTVRLPLERPDDETWKLLRGLASEAARWGNRTLAGQYIQRMAGLRDGEKKRLDALLWADANDRLSGWVRGAMAQKCKAQWQRAGKDVMAGRERLACFSADRALSIAADQSNNRGVLYERDGDDFILACRFEPVEIRDEDGKLIGRREPVRLRVNLKSPGARRDKFIREAVELIWSNTWKPGTLTIRFDRQHRSIDALISVTKPEAESPAGQRTATLGPLDEYGEIWLRIDNGPAIPFTGVLRNIRDKKEHFAGLTRRLLRQGRSPKRSARHHARRKLESIGSFEQWCEGPIHQWSRDVVKACREYGVGTLIVAEIADGEWPADKLKQRLAYKCEDAGITMADSTASSPSHVRAKARKVRKQAQKLARAKEGIEAVKEFVA